MTKEKSCYNCNHRPVCIIKRFFMRETPTFLRFDANSYELLAKTFAKDCEFFESLELSAKEGKDG